MADSIWNLSLDVDHRTSLSRFPLHCSITTDSTEVSKFKSLVFLLQLRLFNASHVTLVASRRCSSGGCSLLIPLVLD